MSTGNPGPGGDRPRPRPGTPAGGEPGAGGEAPRLAGSRLRQYERPAPDRSVAAGEPPAGDRGAVRHETKPAYKTTEFVAFLAVLAGILISAATITGGGKHLDAFTSSQAWLMVTFLTLGYMISRGLAKSGKRAP